MAWMPPTAQGESPAGQTARAWGKRSGLIGQHRPKQHRNVQQQPHFGKIRRRAGRCRAIVLLGQRVFIENTPRWFRGVCIPVCKSRSVSAPNSGLTLAAQCAEATQGQGKQTKSCGQRHGGNACSQAIKTISLSKARLCARRKQD